MSQLVGSNSAASFAQFLPYSISNNFGVYAAQAVEMLTL
jgi:hypothetical protein